MVVSNNNANAMIVSNNCAPGRLLWVLRDGVKTITEQEILIYTGRYSGAYLFMPDAPGVDQSECNRHSDTVQICCKLTNNQCIC